MQRTMFASLAACVLALGLVQVPSAAQEPITESDSRKGQGTENRQWVEDAEDPPDSMSAQQYPVRVEPALIPMRDGTELDARLYLPVRPPGEEPGPCVATADGYGPPSAVGGITAPTSGASHTDLAARGYVGAHVFLRTRDVPEDEAFYYKFAEDGYDIVEWMAEQDWCDGNVGMIGGSLLGISQWLTAREAPPSLQAIVPTIACGDCYRYLWYRGGMLPGDGREQRQPPLTAYDEYGAAIEHRNYDDWWRERDTDSADFQRVAQSDIAVMQCGGWDDYIFAGGVRGVEKLVAAGGDGMQIIGPCAHGGDTPTLVPYDMATYTVLWFDRFLKGIDNGIGEGPGALFYVEGADQYRFEDEWPIPDRHTTQLYLRAEESGSATSLNDGSLTATLPGDDEATVSYDYDPDGPYNNAGGGGVRPTADQRSDEEHSLTWTTPPLEAPTEVTGWPTLRLFASATAPDTDFVVELTEVSPDGTSTTIGRGWLNAPRHFDRTNPEPLEPGRVYEFDVALWPMSYVFQQGHRIRVALSGSDNPGTAPNPEPATVTVHQDAEHRSSIQLPIIGTSWQPLEQASAGTPEPDAESGGTSGESPAGGGDTAILPATGAHYPVGAAVLLLALAGSAWSVGVRRHSADDRPRA